MEKCSTFVFGCTEELHNTQEQLRKAECEREELAAQVKKLTTEVEDVKTAAAIQEVGKEDEIAKAHRQHEEELASFQEIMEGRVIGNDSLLQQLSEVSVKMSSFVL